MGFFHSDPRKDELDLAKYASSQDDPETYYGLPQSVDFCSRCVISNQRPNSTIEHKHTKDSKKQTINFDAEGVCDACRMAERKHDDIDWEERRRELQFLRNKRTSSNRHK